MNDFPFIYWHIILQFLVEIYVFYGLLTHNLRREPLFWLRAVAGGAAMLLLAAGAAAVYPFCGYTVAGRIGIYLVLFGASVSHVWLCFAESFPTILFCCSVSYAAQNLCYKLRLVLADAWQGPPAMTRQPWFPLIYELLTLLMFAAAAALVYLLLVRRVVRHLASWRMDYQMLALFVLVVVVTVVLCSIEDICFSRLSGLSVLAFPEYLVLKETGNLFSVMCCVIVLLLACRMVEQRELRQEVDQLQHVLHQGRRQYEMARDTIEMINVKCHDIRYRLSSLAAQDGKVGRQAVEDLQKSISIYDAKIETGNRMLDVLLTEKSLFCEQNGITFTCMADGEKLSFIEDGDLYCLFGNIVDNALEAVKALPDRDQRVINLLVRSRGGLLLVQEENYFAGSLQFRDGLPLTTKADRTSHGFGLHSIRLIARKYGGVLTTGAQGNVFHLNILFGTDTPD